MELEVNTQKYYPKLFDFSLEICDFASKRMR
jgi:hypothetical protein